MNVDVTTTTTKQVGGDFACRMSNPSKHNIYEPVSVSVGLKLTITSAILAVTSSGLSMVTHEGKRGGADRSIAMALSGSCKVRLVVVALVSGTTYRTSFGR